VRLEGLGQMKSPVTSSGIESATFRLVAQCLRYGVPLEGGGRDLIIGTIPNFASKD
jgi:hypothetical protein